MGRGKTRKSLALIEKAREILEEIQPASVRAVCYRLFVAGYTASMGKNETDRVSDQLRDARNEGAIPWEWIVDATRPKTTVATWSSFGSLLKAAQEQFRRSYWDQQPYQCAVWSEKNTVSGTVWPVLEEYGVDFLPLRGHSSTTIVHSESEASWDLDRPLQVLYLGDWDLAGMDMSERDLPKRIAQYGGNIRLRRLALTREDTRRLGFDLSFAAADKGPKYDSQGKLVSRGDARYPWYVETYGERCWELDALNPNDLRERVRWAIESLIEPDAWERAKRIEAGERATGEAFVASFEGFSRRRQRRAERGT